MCIKVNCNVIVGEDCSGGLKVSHRCFPQRLEAEAPKGKS